MNRNSEMNGSPSREALCAFSDALRRLVGTKTFEQISVRDFLVEAMPAPLAKLLLENKHAKTRGRKT